MVSGSFNPTVFSALGSQREGKAHERNGFISVRLIVKSCYVVRHECPCKLAEDRIRKIISLPVMNQT
jgi:hypothetical protein